MRVVVFDAPPAQAAHAWMPSSPCGPGCIKVTDEVGAVRVVARTLGAAGLLLSFPVLNLATPRGRREHLRRRYARTLLSCLGMQLRIIDNRCGTSAFPQQNRADQRFAGVRAGESRNTGPGFVRADGLRAVRAGNLDDRSASARSGVPAAETRVTVGTAVDAAGTSTRYTDQGSGVLVVTGHIGWTDVVVLAAVQPLGFVARADMVDWPLVGGLARLMGVIPIERERLRELPRVVAQLGARLAAGDRVAVFPEGTTWCGRAYGTMRPALFQAAVDTGTPVQPVRLRYLDRRGVQCTVPGFVGEETFASSAGRVLRSGGMIAEIVLEPPEESGTDRRDLARRCERAVRGTELLRHGSTDAKVWIEVAMSAAPRGGLGRRSGDVQATTTVPGAARLVSRLIDSPPT